MDSVTTTSMNKPWNKGKLVGQKKPLKLKDIWAIRIRLEIANHCRDLAMFNLAIDSKLRACDLVNLRVRDIAHGSEIQSRAMILQQKTQTPVRFELMKHTRESLANWILVAGCGTGDFLFPNRMNKNQHITTRQYARIVKRWINSIGLDASSYATHSLRRSKPALIYKRTKNLRAIQLLLGHTKLESTVRYLGIDVDDALELAEQTEI
ncbi:tyrosine-type recombinase/integrase [Amphritea balenae]|uniref:Integrase n=1 Tax=Amphritea balenae TaxID=452629 RepID=A0A3P1SLD1_9GAMM|nr:tyrosine-type recombinase/integrase [Amphritea balenae]RRC98051.1 integrase [Amphritea balenae]GGK67143.1 phage integrase [Amphritea balenae]